MKVKKFLITILITTVITMANANAKNETATLAGGCFWCIESDFEKIGGIISVTSGYTGGSEPNPTYEQVSSGATGHVEAVQIVFDANIITYRRIMDKFWRSIDPLNARGQFCDIGPQYRSEVFYHNEEQKQIAEETRKQIDDSGVLPSKIVTKITEASEFYPAEEYHQNYYKKNPVRYKYYRYSCGRDKRVEELWGK
ncbi:MAG: peptide-methionine (S)-S-oxide reductase MsrA [Rickettsiales bacterium]|nr:peptide-methionine (S)-S-oxide reductase MsrA [Pseudomonadota bacterium]MDA0965957.1 peptide-methionine (S)-S-oxide reductase MsrA [Pseudomonadota bacterium]MDG4542571.1 peptide-methionine (S)-S-oxide reductase MsrA [Rickettsiales bacterium]MDG4545075.1 peptide-methionine (S)-S-oxide reductase MsrA [Rickettsiales bacterium]MDG4547198.1 peptide-methionine (S)-S-oxide reductase MsrA [Rickettsiales bacterium]